MLSPKKIISSAQQHETYIQRLIGHIKRDSTNFPGVWLAQAVCWADFAEVRVTGRSEMAADSTFAMSDGLSRLCGGASRFLAF